MENNITIKTLVELINCNPYNTEENEDIINYLIKTFSPLSQEIVKIPNQDNPDKFNLLVGVNTKLKNATNAVVLSAHIDTVLPSNNNTTAKIKDGKIFGLGSCDMKTFIANVLTVLQRIETYSRPLILAFTADEETKLKGVTEVTSYFKQNNVKV